MGFYLNSISPFSLYKSEVESPYFVDKALLLEKLFPLVSQGNKHICITRPRRFEKTVMANMVGAFFNKGIDSSKLFSSLKIAGKPGYWEHLNQHHVIYIDFSKLPRNCSSYEQYINRIEKRLSADLIREFPDAEISDDDAIWDMLENIFNECGSPKFIFVLDEWDSIFHKDFVSENDKKNFIEFLSNLLKGNAYVSLTYMTRILPIAKYSSGSALNMFLEYTMITEPMFSEDFGFTKAEVKDLYQRYLKITPMPRVNEAGLKYWYDGYNTKADKTKIYNPRSVVAALTNNNLGDYWNF